MYVSTLLIVHSKVVLTCISWGLKSSLDVLGHENIQYARQLKTLTKLSTYYRCETETGGPGSISIKRGVNTGMSLSAE